MGLREDYEKQQKALPSLRGDSKGRSQPSAASYDPRSTTLLQSQLRKIAGSGNEKALAQAKKVAKGGGGSWATRALTDTLSGLGIPMRAVVATIEDTAEGFTGKRDDRSWLENVRDPTYGTGKVIERAAPHLPWAVKSGLGFIGDVALDPVTYLTFGVSPELEALGKSQGLRRTAFKAARYADQIGDVAKIAGKEAEESAARKSADALRAIADKARTGAALSDDELRHIEQATQFMAEDVRGVPKRGPSVPKRGGRGPLPTEAEQVVGMPFSEMSKGEFAGQQALKDKSLRYGIRWHLPLSEKGVMIPGTAEFGRAMSETGAKVSGFVGEKTGKALGGKLASVKQAVRSGTLAEAEAADALLDATARGAANANRFEGAAGKAVGRAFATLKDAGINGEELMNALGERPMRTAQLKKALEGMTPEQSTAWMQANADRWTGGKAFRDLIEAERDPVAKAKVTQAVYDIGDFYDSLPEATAHYARSEGVERQFIGDAAERGRWAYVPRTMSEDFRTYLQSKGRGSGGQRLRPRPGEESWFMKKAYAPGDKIGEGEEARTIAHVGDVTEHYPEGAPSLEQQTEDALRSLYGDDAIDWYEKDLYKAHDKYITGLAHQIGSQTVQNTLLARGVSRPTLAGALADAQHSLWQENLFGEFDPALGGRRSYSGKVFNQRDYHQLQRYLRTGEPITTAVNVQFTGDIDEVLARVDTMQAQLVKEIEEFGAGNVTDAHFDRLVEQEKAWQTVRNKWEDVKAAEAIGDPMAEHVRLEASRAQIEAGIAGHKATWETMTKDKEFIERLSRALSSGWEGYGFNRQAPSDVVGLMKDIASTYGSSDTALAHFVRDIYDPINHWMKGWLTSSLGFLNRNVFGGTFNNWLAGVRDVLRSTKATWKLIGPGERTFADQATYDVLDRMGVLNSGFFTSDLGRDPAGRLLDLGHGPNQAWSLNPFAGIRGGDKQPLLPFMVRRWNERRIEPMLRGTLARDRLLKAVEQGRFASIGVHRMEDITSADLGARFVREVQDSGLTDEILADVAKYHFDYDDLSRFERQVGRRVIPFYTWTRKNVPLQIEAMFTKPGKTLALYGHVKRNLESATPQQDVVPQWFGGAGLMRLPFQTGGGQVYGSIDLPFKDPFEALDVTGMGLGMISPLVKAPIETRMGSQFFGNLPLRDDSQTGGLKPMPTTWKWMIPLLVAADKLPFSPLHAPIKGKGGQWLMREDDNYLVQQYLPFMAQAQRLFPYEEGKYRNRVATTWLSYLAGVQARTNTPQDMENEVFRRSDEMTAIVNRLKVTGDIASTSTTRKRPQGKPLSEILASLDTG